MLDDGPLDDGPLDGLLFTVSSLVRAVISSTAFIELAPGLRSPPFGTLAMEDGVMSPLMGCSLGSGEAMIVSIDDEVQYSKIRTCNNDLRNYYFCNVAQFCSVHFFPN